MKEFKLNDIDKKHPFKVPDNYFEQLNADILSKIDEKPAVSIKPKTRNNLWYWVAASLTILASSIVFILNFNQDKKVEYLSNISNEEIMFYLDYYEIDELDLLESVTGEMQWMPVEDELLLDVEFESDEIEDIYLEFGVTEITAS